MRTRGFTKQNSPREPSEGPERDLSKEDDLQPNETRDQERKTFLQKHRNLITAVGAASVFLVGCCLPLLVFALIRGRVSVSDVDEWTRSADGMVMVYVPAGGLQMGSTDAALEQADELCVKYRPACERGSFGREMPAHPVALDAFWIDRTEVTNAQYALCVADGSCRESEYAEHPDFNGADHPVVGVDWYNAWLYCQWAGARLPTEAEWEYAARGPEGRVFPWGDTFDGNRLNFCDVNCPIGWTIPEYDDGHVYTAPVGSYPEGASWCGALDMSGNVSEWVADWYALYYPSERRVSPTGPSSGSSKTVRVGSWVNFPEAGRAAARGPENPDRAWNSLEFRCARDSK